MGKTGAGVAVEYVILWFFLLLVILAAFWLPAAIPLISAVL
jgi:hypothetical protein